MEALAPSRATADELRWLLGLRSWLRPTDGRNHPGPRFDVGSMTDLDLPAASVVGLFV